MVPDEVRSRYMMVVDGEVLDGKRVKNRTKDELLAKEYLPQIQHLSNCIDSYKGQIDGLKHELAVTKHHLDQLLYATPLWTLDQDREAAGIGARTVDNTPARDLARELTRRIGRRIGS